MKSALTSNSTISPGEIPVDLASPPDPCVFGVEEPSLAGLNVLSAEATP
jgi:hypothetical protein